MQAKDGSARLDAAIRAWRTALGDAHVIHDDRGLADRARTTLPRAHAPIAVLRPGNTAEVAEILRIAAANGVPVYPVSQGKNWGYGDACPPTAGQALIDLGRMNRILEVDAALAYAVIEPGVTQGQMFAYLRENDIPLWFDCTGAGPNASIVGNVLERGFGHTPYGNRVQTVCGMEVVLPCGRIIETGFGRFAGAKAARTYPYGIGPALDGLFSQSNLGIVTRLGLWLLPKPEHVEMVFCVLDRADDIAPCIEALRPLRLDGTLRSIVHIGNDLRLIASTDPATLGLAATPSRLSTDVRARLRAELGIGAWNLSGSLMGSRAQVAAARAKVRRALRGPHRRLIVLSEAEIALGGWLGRYAFGRWGRRLRRRLASARSALQLNSGQPVAHFLAGAYWRRRGWVPDGALDRADPAADNCGLIWLSPVLPMTGAAVRDFLGLVEPLYERHGFDCPLTLSAINERSLGAVMTIAYDRDDPVEAERAHACFKAVLAAAVGGGYWPYRLGVQSMGEAAGTGGPHGAGPDAFDHTVATIKRALDPNGILAPGRYDLKRDKPVG